ncbi:MAG: hypothetical protein K2X82_11570 [Gemmataceae bacterium]|nr:hypothetical protein [Gemmataceae bacterium]
MRASRWVAAVLFAAGAVAVIEAQPGGFGGRGGFGGGGVNALVLTNSALQAELKVTAEQKEKLKPLAEKQAALQKRMPEIFKEAAGDKDRMKELFGEMREQGEKLQAELKTALDDTLTADQKTRLKQVERQMAGPRAFAADDVAAGLKLTDDQKGKVRGIMDDLGRDTKELFGGGGGKGGFGKGFDPERMAENQKKMEKLNKAAMAEVMDVLNDDQKKSWKEMVGAPFDTSKLFQFPGGGGGKRPRD